MELRSSKVRKWVPALVGGSLALAACFILDRFVAAPVRISTNETAVSQAIISLGSAQVDFRLRDVDQNNSKDYWAGDIAGLYYYAVEGKPLQMINQAIADADASPVRGGGKSPEAFSGYYFLALEPSDEACPEGMRYRRVKPGKLRDGLGFAFTAFPASYGASGQLSFMITEENMVYAVDNGGAPVLVRPCEKPSPHVHQQAFPGNP